MDTPKLLIHDQPLQILPALAKAIGLNEAIFLQQLHYWLRKSEHEHDGKVWIYNTFEDWKEQLPFWSLRTMQRIVKSLVDQKLVDVHQFGAADWDRKNWYAIEYDRLAEIGRQIDATEHAKLASSRRPKRRVLEHAKLASSSTETTQEITSEITAEKRGNFVDELKANSLYVRLDVDSEFSKATVWAEANHRVVNKRMFVNWLNRSLENLPLNGNGAVKDKHGHDEAFYQKQEALARKMGRVYHRPPTA